MRSKQALQFSQLFDEFFPLARRKVGLSEIFLRRRNGFLRVIEIALRAFFVVRRLRNAHKSERQIELRRNELIPQRLLVSS